MGFYTKMGMRLFGQYTDSFIPYFSGMKNDLRRSRLQLSLQEYFSNAIMTSTLVFVFELPLLSFIFGLYFQNFLFGFVSAITFSIFLTITFFFAFLNYPKVIIRERSKKVDAGLPFASLYLAAMAGSKLTLSKTLNMFSKFSGYGEVAKEISSVTKDMDLFGIDINTSLERAVERTPSKDLKELIWGLLSVNKSGGDVNIYLKEKASSLISNYRRKLYDFSHNLSLFIEVYLTSIVLSAIFFTILTSIMGGISKGGSADIIVLQFLLIVVFLPMLSLAFIIFIRSITPGGE